MLQQIAHEWWFFRHESRILDGCTAQKVSARLSLAETFWRSVIKTYVSRHLWILQSAFAIFEAAVQIAVETGSWGCETLPAQCSLTHQAAVTVHLIHSCLQLKHSCLCDLQAFSVLNLLISVISLAASQNRTLILPTTQFSLVYNNGIQYLCTLWYNKYNYTEIPA